jgi:hypothetical protein
MLRVPAHGEPVGVRHLVLNMNKREQRYREAGVKRRDGCEEKGRHGPGKCNGRDDEGTDDDDDDDGSDSDNTCTVNMS